MKTLKIALCIVLLSYSIDAKCQYNNNHWVFGDSAYIDWSIPQSPSVGSASYYRRNGSSSIADSNGLLLYAGLINNVAPLDCYVWNKFHQRIGDTTEIYGGQWYHSSLFIPQPGNDSIIYLFTIGVTSAYGFYSTTINYKANNDSGVVFQKNLQLDNFPAFDALMGVKHGNGRDWWVISQRYSTSFTPFNSFYLFQITPQGIALPVIQNAGSFRKTGGGHLIFNSAGTQFAQVSWMGMIELYNFDRCNGSITSTIPIEQEPTNGPYPNAFLSCAYSNDDSKLYITQLDQSTVTYYILQYDLLATNIAASKFVVDSFFAPSAPAQMKLAPDDKIYISSFDETFSWPYPDTITAYTAINNNLSVINYPDSLGSACDFQPFSFNLGTGRSYFGLPNNPDYELSAWVGSPCDTLTVGLPDPGAPSPSEERGAWMQAWYNSEWNMIHVNASKLKGKSGVLRLFDVEGRVVYERKVDVIAGGYFTGEVMMNGIASGVYIVSLSTEKDKVQEKVLKF